MRGKLKPVSLIVLLAVATVLLPSQSVRADSLVGHWRFDETVAGDAADDVGDNDAVDHGNPAPSTDVPSGLDFADPRSIELDGPDYYTLERPVQDDFTICAWFKTSVVGNGTDHFVLAPILESETGGVASDFGFGIDSNGHLAYGNGDGSEDVTVSTDGAVNDNAWHHGCVTRNGTTGLAKLYVDGALDNFDTLPAGTLDSNGAAVIGNGTDGATSFVGKIDDLRTYDYILTASAIEQLYEGQDNVTPDMQCAAPQSSATTITMNCDLAVEDDVELGPVTWEARYTIEGEDDYTDVEMVDNTTGEITFTGLTPSTSYQVELRPNTNLGQLDWGYQIIATAGSNNDEDDDGIDDLDELAGPTDGDANLDNILDSLQAHVATFVSPINDKYVTLESDEDCPIVTASLVSETRNDAADSFYSYPLGLMHFVLECEEEGATASIRQLYHNADFDNFDARKYDEESDSYRTIENAHIQANESDDWEYVQLSYNVTDGGSLDQDGIEDGVIIDPAGLGISIGSPNTGVRSPADDFMRAFLPLHHDL